jgi:hypothetical protein
MTDIPLEQPGLDALRKERERADGLQKQLKELQLKIQSGDVLASELQTTKTLLAEVQAQKDRDIAEVRSLVEAKDKTLKALRIEQQFNRAAAATKLNSVYAPILLGANASNFVVADDGSVTTTDGKTLTEWIDGQREQLPDLFEAPNSSGSGARSSRNNFNGGKKVVSRDDGKAFMQNLDAIADGSILTE